MVCPDDRYGDDVETMELVAITDGPDMEVGPYNLSVLGEVALRDGVEVSVRVDAKAFCACCVAFGVVRVGDGLCGPVEEFTAAKTNKVTIRIITSQEAMIRIHKGHRNGRLVKQEALPVVIEFSELAHVMGLRGMSQPPLVRAQLG